MDWLTQINYLTIPTKIFKEEEVVVYASDYLHKLMALIKETDQRYESLWTKFLVAALSVRRSVGP